jgi:hypothetical protein
MSDNELRIRPVAPGESSDEDINELLRQTELGWWQDSRMFGVIAHVPEALRAWVQLIAGTATVLDPVIWELMALRGAFVTGCHY